MFKTIVTIIVLLISTYSFASENTMVISEYDKAIEKCYFNSVWYEGNDTIYPDEYDEKCMDAVRESLNYIWPDEYVGIYKHILKDYESFITMEKY